MGEGSAPGGRLDTDASRSMMEALLRRLFPICRSITGEGIRRTLRIIGEHVPLEWFQLPSGARVFDWTVPNEWNIRDAYIKDSTGRRLVDFRASNLHVVNYSVPVRRRMSLEALRPHLHTLPKQPTAIPYVTSYYEKQWGFCLSHQQYQALRDGEYDVRIDSTLQPGQLTWAEAVLPGETSEEILFSTYCCHPSMANNELSGPITVTALYRYVSSLPSRRYTYLFYYGPETIGALAYLSMRGDHLKAHLAHGFVVTCCGDSGPFTYKRTKDPASTLDKHVLHALKHSRVAYRTVSYFPESDDRQYSSPGWNLSMGTLARSIYGSYPEYHTSLDNLDFVSTESLLETLNVYLNVLDTLEHNTTYRNLKPYGQPQLGKYGLYPSIAGRNHGNDRVRQLEYLLSFSDGVHDLLDIADKLEQPIWELEGAVRDLVQARLLAPEQPAAGARPLREPGRKRGSRSFTRRGALSHAVSA